MKEEKEILEILENARPILSASSREALWERIYSQVESVPVVSPYYSMFVMYKKHVAVFLVVLLVVSGGGTAYAGNQARPGERLFALDKALEQAELTLTPTIKLREKARVRHGEERLAELREIITEVGREHEDVPEVQEAVTEILRFVEDTDFDDTAKGEFMSRVVREVGEERRDSYGLPRVRVRTDDERGEVKKDRDGERRTKVRGAELNVDIKEKDGKVHSKTSGGRRSSSDDRDNDFEDGAEVNDEDIDSDDEVTSDSTDSSNDDDDDDDIRDSDEGDNTRDGTSGHGGR